MRTEYLTAQPGQTEFPPYKVVLKIEAVVFKEEYYEDDDDLEDKIVFGDLFVHELPVDEDDLDDAELDKLLKKLGYDEDNAPIFTITEWVSIVWINPAQIELPFKDEHFSGGKM